MEFKDAVRFVLELEGGDRLVDHPKDPGGLTKFGISLRAFPELGRQGIIDLTEAEAMELYRKHYWDRLGIDRLPERLRLAVFDAAVNHGPHAAVELLQKSLRKLGAKILVDGELGVRTLASVKNYSQGRILVAFLLDRLRFYRSLESYNTFGFGWERRILEVAISA